ncbi:MAG TPA: hypothetical protein VMM92_13610, partial [Thermoanaerobaculia bacterium]|nr:hypothetical protein [Thermoanaerobaculia bacterium]
MRARTLWMLVGLVGLFLSRGAQPLHAACEICTYHNMVNGYFGWCTPAQDGNTGVTQCTDQNSMDGPSCFEAGDA